MLMRPLLTKSVAILAICLWCAGGSCAPNVDDVLLPASESDVTDTDGLTLVARVVHLSDTHIVDEESPARFIGAQAITRSAWRPWEVYSTQILDGILRTTNNMHEAGMHVDFIVHTGDGCDNAQMNELGWMLDLFDGGEINPRSGPDDRESASLPPIALDPHAPFDAQGLYRHAVHGPSPTIPWYAVFGNHDTYAIGVFPIVEDANNERVAPLPLDLRPGILFPSVFRPTGMWANGKVTPAFVGPPSLTNTAIFVEPNSQRAYFTRHDFIRALFDTETLPAGHGFSDPEASPSWYSVSPLPGLRLIGLDTTDHPIQIEGFVYIEGGLSAAQRDFLIAELDRAQATNERVIIATHHPSESLIPHHGSALVTESFRDLLKSYPCVVAHLAGHRHRHRVIDHGTYLEIETGSTLDWPQEGRNIEIWRDELTDETVISYDVFSHLDDRWPALTDDPQREMRTLARQAAREDQLTGQNARAITPNVVISEEESTDRSGRIRLSRLSATD